MSEEEIINYWKEGFSVEQIIQKHPKRNIINSKDKSDWTVRNRIETVILKYQTKGE